MSITTEHQHTDGWTHGQSHTRTLGHSINLFAFGNTNCKVFIGQREKTLTVIIYRSVGLFSLDMNLIGTMWLFSFRITELTGFSMFLFNHQNYHHPYNHHHNHHLKS